MPYVMRHAIVSRALACQLSVMLHAITSRAGHAIIRRALACQSKSCCTPKSVVAVIDRAEDKDTSPTVSGGFPTTAPR